MDLKSHLDLVGLDPDSFAFRARLPSSVIQAVLNGKPVTAVHATKITELLSNLHGMPKREGFEVSDIDNLFTISPNELKAG